jgi:8-oxo-dGTP pyrophosphatase MutT (NUDIX family)
LWDSSASGHLDRGEDYDACALREVWEELGVRLAGPPARVFKVPACVETGHEFVWVYRTQHEGPFQLHPEEIETGAWFDPATVSGWIQAKPGEFTGGLILIWRQWTRTAAGA